MMVGLLRDMGLRAARERARDHICRCVDAGLPGEAEYWMRVSNLLDGIASTDLKQDETGKR